MTARNSDHRLSYTDLREWIQEAEKLGEIVRLKGMSWQREIGMVSALLQRADPSPCAIFEDIPGVPNGFRILTNFFGAKRANITLGFPPGMTKVEVSDGFFGVYRDPDNKPIKHKIVEQGPILENVLSGDAVDITMFPAPQWHEADGGRYIGTGCYCVTRDPEDGWLNQGTYRVMVHDRNTVTSTIGARNGFLAEIAAVSRLEQTRFLRSWSSAAGSRKDPRVRYLTVAGDESVTRPRTTHTPSRGFPTFDSVAAT